MCVTHHHVTYDALQVYLFLADDVWFSLNCKTYQNNSIVSLEDIGEGNVTALRCITNFIACCKPPYTGGKWFFPNGTEVPSSGEQWDFHRTRGQSVILLNRRRGGVEGIYRCEIPVSMNVMQSIYIGVYTAGTGEWYRYSIVILQGCL